MHGLRVGGRVGAGAVVGGGRWEEIQKTWAKPQPPGPVTVTRFPISSTPSYGAPPSRLLR